MRQETRQETAIDTIVTIMRALFKKDVPADLRDWLAEFSQQELRDITVRAATVASAEDVLAGKSLSGSQASRLASLVASAAQKLRPSCSPLRRCRFSANGLRRAGSRTPRPFPPPPPGAAIS